MSEEMTFTISKAESEKLEQWVNKLQKEGRWKRSYDPSGGDLSITFYPSALGTAIRVKNMSNGEEIDITDYDNW